MGLLRVLHEAPPRFNVTVVRHPAEVDFMADVAVRHDPVETYRDAHRNDVPARVKRQTMTIGGQTATLAGAGLRRWTVAQAEDVSVAVNGLLEDFHRFGEPFLRRFRSMDEVRQVLLHEPAFARLICPVAEFRKQVLEAIHVLSRPVA